MNKIIKSAIPYMALTFLGYLLYYHILGFRFTYLDDAGLIITTAKEFSSDPLSVLRIFIKDIFYIPSQPQPQIWYRPLFTASFMINSLLGRNSLAGYYFINIVLHIIASCLIFRVLVKLGYKKISSFILSALFIVSPMLVQTVAWLPGRSDTLVAILSLLSFMAFMDFVENAKARGYFLHISLLSLAFFTKENALCLIPVCFLYLRLISKQKLFCVKENFLAAGWLATLALWLLLRYTALTDPLKLTVPQMLYFMAINSIVIIQYVGRIFFPFSLSVWPTVPDSQTLPGIAAMLILILLLAVSKKQRLNYVAFGMAWFILLLLPALVRPNIGVSAVFSNTRVYLPMVGILIMLAETDIAKDYTVKKWFPTAVISCIVILYFLTALNHTYDFRNSSAFWANARMTAPHSWRGGSGNE